MKKNNSKKVLSVFAVLAVSTTMAMTAIPFAACSDKTAEVKPSNSNIKTVTIDTALGTTQSRSTGKVLWVAPEAQTGTGDGSFESPYHISSLLNDKWKEDGVVGAGDTILVKPGTYVLGNTTRIKTQLSGTFDKYITIRVATHEDNAAITDGKATLDFHQMSFDGSNRGVQLEGDYIYWYGIDICGAGDNGMYVAGDFNTVENCEFYNNRDTGLQLGRAASDLTHIEDWPNYNLIKNCTSHNNYDNETYGENADGFAAKLTVGYGNVFDGCIAYRNSDDGWDLYAKSDSGNIGTVIMYNCVAYENGYLEYTRDECNAMYPTFVNENFPDGSTNPYLTRDGDGNGFKLGGSIMEGDVIMYNCLAFQNRMHGVTDNSNPGYLKVENVTSYDNSAAIDATGRVASVANSDTHGNIDVSRQTYSYNGVINALSVMSPIAKSLDNDAYRGTVTNSLLNAKTKTNVIKGSGEFDTKNAGGKTFTSQVNALDAATMFKTLPVVLNGTEYTYNVDGAEDSMTFETKAGATYKSPVLKESRAHVVYRNEDGSINMGDILAKTEAAETLIASYLGEGVDIGSTLNKTSWEDYVHFYEKDLTDGSVAADKSVVDRTAEVLTLNCDENAVYQDFDVPTNIWNTTISWASSDDSLVVVGTEVTTAVSNAKYIDLIVTRPYDEDKTVTVTATIKYGSATTTKDFELVIKKGDPSLGELSVVTQDNQKISNNGTLIIDQYAKMGEPEVLVLNGLYPDAEKVLDKSLYSVNTKYEYATDKNANKTEVHAFTPSKAGVFTITNTVTLNGDGANKGQKASMSYTVYVASTAAKVDLNNAVVSVYKDGFNIAGDLTSATGKIYAVSSSTALTDLTAANIATYKGVESFEFRSNSISCNFTNANSGSYYVYYAIANLNGEITSVGDNQSGIYSVQVAAIDVDSEETFAKLAKDGKLGEEEPSQTLYLLTKDLDFTDVAYTIGSGSFKGVFNGNGHTISNLTTESKGIFNKVVGGTIMNVKFENLTINNGGEKVGLIVESTGGYFYNIAFKNVNIGTTASKRVAALIGHIGGSSDGSTAVSDTFISQISIINDANHKITASTRAAGLIGYVQYYRANITIENCYVKTDLDTANGSEAGGMIASWEDTATDTLKIVSCVYDGTIYTSASSTRGAGMLGYHKGGAGTLYVERCLSLAKIVCGGVELGASIKNSSPIIGNYSSSATVRVTNCIALMEEYNTDYDVAAYNITDIAKATMFGVSNLNFDLTKWSLVFAEGSNTDLVAPYVTLLFL